MNVETVSMEYALITGASSGLGLEFALQLAERGYGIIIVGNRHDENLEAVRKVKARENVDVRVIDADLALHNSAQMVYDTVTEWGLKVEVLVSNAGMLLFSTLTRTSIDCLDKIVSLHCSTPVKLIRLFGEDMQKREKGYILITSSSTAWMPFPTISLYGATKTFLKNFSRSVWYEFKRYNVGVTTLFPGAVDTPLYKLDEDKRKLCRTLGLMQTPQQVVASALKCLFKCRYRCVPGFFTKLSVFLCRIAPIWLLQLLLKIPAIKRLYDSV